MDKEQEAIQQGMQADRLINDPTIQAAFAAIRLEILAAWRATKPSDKDGRERLYAQSKAIDLFETKLNHFIQNGRLAEENISAMQRLKDKAQRILS